METAFSKVCEYYWKAMKVETRHCVREPLVMCLWIMIRVLWIC